MNSTKFAVPEDFVFFNRHFPGDPILPGAVSTGVLEFVREAPE